MATLYRSIGEKNEKNLLARPSDDYVAVPLLPGKGELKIGTLLYRDSLGYWEPAASGQINGSYELAVLKEDIDTGEDAAAISEDGIVYRSGHFINGAVILNGGGTLSAAHKLVLRGQGIVFDPANTDGTFDNDTVDITYVGNNSVPAEEDVTIKALKGSTYTILNNSDDALGFTAPAGKTFSKWNTKADGTGTDYAAAATYTASADLKLYAVWAS